MRFDLEKWLHDNHYFYEGRMVSEAIEAAESALLAPSPCGVEGHDMRDWVEERTEWDGPGESHAEMVKGHCTRCQELSRVGQQARAEALEQAAEADEVSKLVHRVDVLLPRLSDTQQITLRKDVLVALLYRKASELLNNALPALPGGYIARSEVEALIESRVSERTKRLIAKWWERRGGPWDEADVEIFKLLNDIWIGGFEQAHELRTCGHSCGDYRDAGYIPGKPETYTGSEACVGCERTKRLREALEGLYNQHRCPFVVDHHVCAVCQSACRALESE